METALHSFPKRHLEQSTQWTSLVFSPRFIAKGKNKPAPAAKTAPTVPCKLLLTLFPKRHLEPSASAGSPLRVQAARGNGAGQEGRIPNLLCLWELRRMDRLGFFAASSNRQWEKLISLCLRKLPLRQHANRTELFSQKALRTIRFCRQHPNLTVSTRPSPHNL